jgi:hypothetical protein
MWSENQGNRPFVSSTHIWKDLKEPGCDNVDWIQLPKDMANEGILWHDNEPTISIEQAEELSSVYSRPSTTDAQSAHE